MDHGICRDRFQKTLAGIGFRKHLSPNRYGWHHLELYSTSKKTRNKTSWNTNAPHVRHAMCAIHAMRVIQALRIWHANNFRKAVRKTKSTHLRQAMCDIHAMRVIQEMRIKMMDEDAFFFLVLLHVSTQSVVPASPMKKLMRLLERGW